MTRHRSDLVACRATRPTAHAQPGSGLEGAKKGGRGSQRRAEAGLPEDARPKISGQSRQSQARLHRRQARRANHTQPASSRVGDLAPLRGFRPCTSVPACEVDRPGGLDSNARMLLTLASWRRVDSELQCGRGRRRVGGETGRLHGQVESILSCETAVALHALESMRSGRAQKRAWAASRSRLDRRTRRIMRPRPGGKAMKFDFLQKSSFPQINSRDQRAKEGWRQDELSRD